MKKKIIIIDFNGDCLNRSNPYQEILKLFLNHASLVLFHILSDEADDKYLKEYFDIFSCSKAKVKVKVILANSMFSRC